MRQTVVGVFDSDAEAQRAAQALATTGIDPACVHVTHGDDELAAGTTTTTEAPRETGVLGRVRNFFADLFGPDDEREVGHYAEAMRRGAAVVKVDVDDDTRLDQVRDALQNAGAVDIDERVESWRAEGWSDAELGQPSTAASAVNTTLDDDLRDREATARVRATGDTEDVIPVVREELQVGKRAVSTGGVRVYSRTVETPVSESVQLRQEHAEVERRAVDRPATAADLADLKDRTIEVRETAEQAVVQKTARVVEEVRVGKTVEQRTEQISDTVRSTEVEVENLPGGARADTFDADYYRNDFSTRFAGQGGRWEDYEPAYRYGYGLRSDTRYAGRDWDAIEPDVRRDYETRYPGGTWERMKAAVRRGWERTKDAVTPDSTRTTSAFDDDYYRQDWQTNYAGLGGRYEDYEPAYRYGSTLRADPRYAGRNWDEIEADARRDYETRYPGSTWERMKAAVRRGWDRVTS